MKREDVEGLLKKVKSRPRSCAALELAEDKLRDAAPDLARALLAAMDEIEVLKAKADAEYWRGREDAAQIAERFDPSASYYVHSRTINIAAAIRARVGK